MRPFGVVVDKPVIEIGLQGLDAVIEVLAQLDTEELLEEALDEAVGFRRPDLGARAGHVFG